MTDSRARSPGRQRTPAQKAIAVAQRRLGKGAERAATAFVNGIDWWLRDPTDVVDRTPHDVIHTRDKLVVRRYRPLQSELDWGIGHVRETTPATVPVLLVPPLMVRPFIFDLTERRSFARTLLKRGFDTYLVDWGEPDREDATVRIEDYVLRWLPDAINAACTAAGTDSVYLVGYCQGGMFALMCAATTQDPRIAGIAAIASPIDSAKMGVIGWLARNGHPQIDQVVRLMGNVPGELSSTAFKLVDPLKSVTRYSDLFMNLYNDEYVDGFDALSAWTGNFIDYPQGAFRQLLRDFMRDNKLKDGRWQLGENGQHVADLRNITCPVLAFAGQTDKIVPIRAVRELMAVVGSEDKRFEVVPGGHMGVFAGRAAPDEVWAVIAAWMAEHEAR